MTDEEYQEFARDFAKRLKPWRLAANMTQKDLSELCGISNVSISAIENGDHIVTKRHMIAIIKDGFEISFERFFTETPNHHVRQQRVTGCRVPNLKDWRMSRGLTARKLASLVFVSPATISYIENGGNTSRVLALRIANMLEVSLEDMAQSPIHRITGDPEAALLEGKSGAQIAREFNEKYIWPVRRKNAHEAIVALQKDATKKRVQPITPTEQDRELLHKPESQLSILETLKRDVLRAQRGELYVNDDDTTE